MNKSQSGSPTRSRCVAVMPRPRPAKVRDALRAYGEARGRAAAATRELEHLSDHMLRDIGLHRSQIDAGSRRDTAVVVIRPLRVQDAAAFRAFLERLSPASRYARFQYVVKEVSPQLLRLLLEADPRSHVALGAFDGERLVGEARYVRRKDPTRRNSPSRWTTAGGAAAWPAPA